MNKIDLYIKTLLSKGIPETNEGMLIVRRCENYLNHLNAGDITPIYNIFAFYNTFRQLDRIVNNTLNGEKTFTSVTGLLEQAYLSDSDSKLDSFVIFLPSNFNPEKKYPLIVFLHGYGEWTYLPLNSTAHNELIKTCNKKEVILAAPSGKHIPEKGVPSYERGEKDVLQVIKIIKDLYNIDSARVYLTGVSMGGHGTWYMGSKYAHLFTAIAPVCGYGAGEFGSPVIDFTRLSKLPLYAFHGETDTIVPVSCSRTLVQQMKEREYDVSYKEFQNVGHDCWDCVYKGDFLVEWFLQHSKNIVL